MNILAFDIGGTFIKWGVLSENDFSIIEKGKFDTEAKKLGGKGIIEKVANFANGLIKKYNLVGVGISMPGVVDSEKGIILGSTPNIPKSQGIEIFKIFNSICSLNLVIHNDVNSATIGELVSGNLKNSTNGIMITIGTGIGGGIVINGKLYEGSTSWAGEVGRKLFHNNVEWEKIASTKVLLEEIESRTGKKISGEVLFDDLSSNKIYQEVLDKFYYNLSVGIADLLNILNPDTFIIGGGISENDNFKVEDLKKSLGKLIPDNLLNSVSIRKALLGNNASLIGISKLFTNKYK